MWESVGGVDLREFGEREREGGVGRELLESCDPHSLHWESPMRAVPHGGVGHSVD